MIIVFATPFKAATVAVVMVLMTIGTLPVKLANQAGTSRPVL